MTNQHYELDKPLPDLKRDGNRYCLISTNLDVGPNGDFYEPVLALINICCKVRVALFTKLESAPLRKNKQISPLIFQFSEFWQCDLNLKRASWLKEPLNSRGNPTFVHERLVYKDAETETARASKKLKY